MCGVFGTFMRDDLAEVEAGLDRLAHRGPDGRGVVVAGEAVHGHVRLSLVDLSDASAQPFRRGDLTLSFVGEVWNHRELRAELRGLGERFVTTGDTEVLAAALLRWGPTAALGRLDGMFAFAASTTGWDALARDRFGKVPLFVRREGRRFSWSSERKAWGRTGGAAAPLPPGSLLDLRTGELRRWYGVPEVEPLSADELADLISVATAKRLTADAPVCVLASGGLDSSLILRAAADSGREVVAFAAVLDEASDDLRWARVICSELGIRLIEARVPPPTAESLAGTCAGIETASKAQIEIGALCVPLARAVAAEGFKACLSGEGADELFGGYGNSCIRAASLDDAGWRSHRLDLLEKMSRGNFVRCNLAFMAAGVECRLPFMEKRLVEGALSTGKAGCPPGKGLLKRAAEGLLPRELIARRKDTFQGGSGMSAAAASVVHDPLHFYHAECRRAFGRVIL